MREKIKQDTHTPVHLSLGVLVFLRLVWYLEGETKIKTPWYFVTLGISA